MMVKLLVFLWLCHDTCIDLFQNIFFMHISTVSDPSTERDLQKTLQQMEPLISLLEDLTKMGGAMRSILTRVLGNHQIYKDLSTGDFCKSALLNNLKIMNVFKIPIDFRAFTVLCICNGKSQIDIDLHFLKCY